MNRLLSCLLLPALLAGCAATQLDANVHTQGAWPADRVPGSYAFQRLPSQLGDGQQQDQAEAEARPALEQAGFRPVQSGGEPEVLVQVAKRTGQSVAYVPGAWGAPFYGPYWPYGGFYGGGWRGGRWGYGTGWGFGAWDAVPYAVYEVSVLILDAHSQAALYESRARSDGGSGDQQTWSALFLAALRDFPYNAVSPRRVVVLLPVQGAGGAASAPK